MKWFDKWFRNKCKQAWESVDDDQGYVIEELIDNSRPRGLRGKLHTVTSNDVRTPNANGANFILYPATGGNILEVRIYDEKIGDNHTSLHIIPTDQDLGESIGKIITIEALKR